MVALDELDNARECFQAQLRERLRPGLDPGAPASWDQRWGEVRSLAHQRPSGGEGWSEWAPVFEGLPRSALEEPLEYLAVAWDDGPRPWSCASRAIFYLALPWPR